MSLINDALKRANEQKAKQVSAAELGSSLQTVETLERETNLLPIAIMVVLLGGSVWMGWSWWSGSHSPATAATETVDVAARTSTPAAPAAEPVVPTAAIQPPVITPPPPTPPPQPAAVPTPATAPAPAAQAAVQPPSRQPVLTAVPVASRDREPVANSNPAVAQRTTPAANPAAPAEPATFPKLVLQGIYYRPSRPSVVINSKTLYVGDKVSQAKVLSIDRREVTVQWGNEVRVLAFE